MSVIVKGMEMPVSGTKYRVVEDLEGNKYLTLDGFFNGQYYPISPLPEKHGRLIDESWIQESIEITLESLKKHPKMDGHETHLLAAFTTLSLMADRASTIIEAEGE